jgi:class 3 adenylate cyclase/GAF domain-containing protein
VGEVNRDPPAEAAPAGRGPRWSVRARIALACVCCAVIPLFAYASYTYVKTAHTLRDLESVRLIEREVAVGRALDDLTSTSLDASADYASWQPLLSALAKGDNTEVRRQLETLAAKPGALAQIYSTDGRLLVSGGGGAMASSLWRVPEVERLTQGLSGGEHVAGFETIAGKLWVVSAEYLHGAGSSRPQGVLVTARPLDKATLASIEAATDVGLTPAGEAEARAAGTDQTAGAASGVLNQVGAPFDETSARSVYLAVYDADGYRSGLIKMAMDRTVVINATAGLRNSAAAALLLALAASVVAALLLSRRITRPLRRLATAAAAIAGGETRQRIAVGGSDEIARLAGAFNTMSESVSDRVADLSGRLAGLTSELADLNLVFGRSVSDVVDLSAELQHMLPHVATMLHADDACLFLGEGGGLRMAACRAPGAGPQRDAGDCVCGSPGGERLAGAAAAAATPQRSIAGEGEAPASLAAAPLVRGGVVTGVLVAGRRAAHAFDDEDAALLSLLAGQMAVALRNADTYERLEGSFLATVAALAGALEVGEGHSPDHPRAVADVAAALGALLGLTPAQARLVRYGGVLHDIGKIGVSERILHRASPLSDEEFRVVTTHPVMAESILARIEYLRPLAPVVRSAHERWDGAGYPDGLAGDDIPLESRIILVADAYVSMTADRPYRPALSHTGALAAVRDGAGRLYDPTVAAAMLRAGDQLIQYAGAQPRRETAADRVLATVLFLDIVDSTVRAAEIGDGAWKTELQRFYATVDAMLKEYRGTEIDRVGDGVFARFDGAARAVRCALALRDAVVTHGLRVRAGCHSGEIELTGDEVRGLAVHIGARVASKAGPGEVLVSSTVCELVAGSGLAFTDRGEHTLKGVPGSWRLYAAEG